MKCGLGPTITHYSITEDDFIHFSPGHSPFYKCHRVRDVPDHKLGWAINYCEPEIRMPNIKTWEHTIKDWKAGNWDKNATKHLTFTFAYEVDDFILNNLGRTLLRHDITQTWYKWTESVEIIEVNPYYYFYFFIPTSLLFILTKLY